MPFHARGDAPSGEHAEILNGLRRGFSAFPEGHDDGFAEGVFRELTQSADHFRVLGNFVSNLH